MLSSYHYSYAKAQLLGALLKLNDRFTVFAELSLKIAEKDFQPDACLYLKREVDFSLPDVVIMTDMPVLAIEILSQEQTIQEALERIAVYFNNQVKSCWLVIPMAKAVVVYASLDNAQRFTSGEVVDELLDIRLPLLDIFD